MERRERRAAREGAGAPARRDARPVEHRVAGVPQLGGDERLDLHRARARERLPRPPRDERAPRAGRAARGRARADRARQRRGRAAAGRGAARCSREGDELVTPWPSYPLYPLMAARAGAQAGGRGHRATGIEAAAARPSASAPACSCSATRTTPPAPISTRRRSAGLLRALPERVHVLLDEALVHFQDVEDVDACLRLTDEFPRLVCFRTFSKVYGLSGLRAGYAVGSPDARRAARSHRAGARRERAHAVGGRPGAQDRRPRGRAAAGVGDPRAPPPARRRCASCRSTRTTARPTSSGCAPTG